MGYQSVWEHEARAIVGVLNDIKEEYPDAWQRAHNPRKGDKVEREEYCQRVCTRLRAIGIPAGLNGKRGSLTDLSEDCIALPRTDALGAPDLSGRFPSIEIRDIIASAGPDAEGNQAGRPVFGDVTQATLDKGEAGRYVEPILLEGQSRPPVRPTPPPQTPPPTPDLPVDRIAVLESQVATLLSGIGMLSAQVSDLRTLLLEPAGAFDTLTKRIFGVGTDDAGVAEEVILRLQQIDARDRVGALEGCRVVSYLRQR